MEWLTAFGLLALIAFYALESRSPAFVLAFAVACLGASVYGFLSGAWPFWRSRVAVVGRGLSALVACRARPHTMNACCPDLVRPPGHLSPLKGTTYRGYLERGLGGTTVEDASSTRGTVPNDTEEQRCKPP